MINKKEFDLLLKEIFQIENKIEEVKILSEFDEASEFERKLESIRFKAKDIVLDNDNKSDGFDLLSIEIFANLIELDSEIDYYILKKKNIIESAVENQIDAEALQKIKILWESIEKDITIWHETEHNPIEDVEFQKHIGKTTLDIIVYQLQIEGILDFTKVFRFCKKEYLINALKENLYDGAKDEKDDFLAKQRLIDIAKKVSEEDLYDYKIWKQILDIRGVKAYNNHIEILGNLQEKDNTKFYIPKDNKPKNKDQDLEIYDDGSIAFIIKNWFASLRRNSMQKRMYNNWLTIKGPAFKTEIDEDVFYFFESYINKNYIENAKKLVVASNGVAKYNFEKNAKWNNLEEIKFLGEKGSSSINLSPDKTYQCIGNDSFSNCPKLKNIFFGKIELIGERAFKNCDSITELVFPESIMNIGEDAFCDCKNLKKVTYLGKLETYILGRPQNIINYFENTGLEEIVYPDIESAFNFVITNCPSLNKITVSCLNNISIPFKICKYRLGREEGIVTFVGEKSLNLWKKRNGTIRFFELTEDDKAKYKIRS